ncbi:hypothetical protein [Actinotignum schaalii]|uniref:hypothetical protein n=1 Tax=Actinotignum schaalii TaxID=59505 RepID=UPI0011DCC38A|nr:hypothetical protein [Actinotignum schaalii]WQN44997.1 hypothetical protein U4A90_08415 [Actinotignum schaalii]
MQDKIPGARKPDAIQETRKNAVHHENTKWRLPSTRSIESKFSKQNSRMHFIGASGTAIFRIEILVSAPDIIAQYRVRGKTKIPERNVAVFRKYHPHSAKIFAIRTQGMTAQPGSVIVTIAKRGKRRKIMACANLGKLQAMLR